VSAKSDHLRELARAARNWGTANADFSEASDRLAELLQISADHAGDQSSEPALRMRAFARMLQARAAQSREDALDIAPLAPTLDTLAEEND